MQPVLQLDDEAEDEELEDESDGNHSNTLVLFTVKLNELVIFLYYSPICPHFLRKRPYYHWFLFTNAVKLETYVLVLTRSNLCW